MTSAGGAAEQLQDVSFIAEPTHVDGSLFKVHTAVGAAPNKENAVNQQRGGGASASALCKSRKMSVATAKRARPDAPSTETPSAKRAVSSARPVSSSTFSSARRPAGASAASSSTRGSAAAPTRLTAARTMAHPRTTSATSTTTARGSRLQQSSALLGGNKMGAATTTTTAALTAEQAAALEAITRQFPTLVSGMEDFKQTMLAQQTAAQAHAAAERDGTVQALTAERDRLLMVLGEVQSRQAQLQESERAALTEVEVLRGVAQARQAEVERASVELLDVQQRLRQVEALLEQATQLAEARGAEIFELSQQLATREATIREMEEKMMEDEALRRKLHNEVQDLKGNIRVFCRVRPLIASESQQQHALPFAFDPADPRKIVVNEQSTSVTGKSQTTRHNFSYDKVFGPAATQEEVFDELAPLVQSVLDGYSCCIFAYGQTSSGKTFTMEGPSQQQKLSDIDAQTAERGVIPRAVEMVFRTMQELRKRGWDYKLEVSFLEVYNEQLRDLLAAPGTTAAAAPQLKHDASGKAYVADCRVQLVTTAEQVYDMLAVARANRSVAATRFNDYSSRSHSVFQLRVTGRNDARKERVASTLNLVDLAGSERLDAASGKAERQKETQSINLSLHHLRNVIAALAARQAHIPYRASVLTQLLQPALGGEAKMLMFVNVAPSAASIAQSLSSLRFATTANTCHIGTVQRQASSSSSS